MSELLEIAASWSFWDREIPESVPRHVELPSELSTRYALVIQGVRRCGKSTLMQQLIGRYGLLKEECLFLNLEDPRLSNSLEWETLQKITDEFEERLGRVGTYFLDEIQLVTGWEKWLRLQLDTSKGRRFVISGSNAHLLSGELASTLTGRHILVELFPFDFLEFKSARADGKFEAFLQSGGFPEALKSRDGDMLLRQYFLDIIERDVRERVGARSSLPLRQLVQMTFESAGSELSLRRLAGPLGLSTDTVSTYIEAAQSAYLLFGCQYFDWSARKRLVRNTKFYPIDTALRRVSVTQTGRDKGKMLECATYLALRRQTQDVFYWRDKSEVDFVVLHDGRPTPIQVTWDEPADRHLRALEEFYRAFPTANEAIFVTADTFDSLNIAPLSGVDRG